MRKVFLEDLPKWEKGTRFFGKIKWKECKNYKVHFIYENIESDLEIVDYIEKRNEIKIKYNNNIHITKTSNFIRGQVGKIIGKITNEFKFDLGEILKNSKRDLIIIEQEYRKQRRNNKNDIDNKKWYKYKCNICNYESYNTEVNLQSGQGCPLCSNKVIIKGVNDIATTHPHLVQYFVNIEDAYSNTYGSSKRVKIKCTDCGNEKNIVIRDLIRLNGSGCPKCGDGQSYPEKFMFSALEQLLKNNFTYQYTKKDSQWCDKYKYDFYFELKNNKYILEIHGQQHYTNTFFSIKSNKK